MPTSTSGTWFSASNPKVLILLLLAAHAAAGEGRISGLVTDPTGAVIPRLTVRLSKAASTELPASTTTSDDGTFEFLAKAGLYDVTFVGFVSGGFGFKSETIKDVRLEHGAAVELPAMRLSIVSPCSISIDPAAPISRKSRIKRLLGRMGLVRNVH
ncbi:MAG: carboxypeptidase regulatory-like domain-containing protein [Bryobacterales bacterium]|nr:carboxypeptidase regulatory-like domain-containing protein [Bryobacterales bacterium]